MSVCLQLRGWRDGSRAVYQAWDPVIPTDSYHLPRAVGRTKVCMGKKSLERVNWCKHKAGIFTLVIMRRC